MYTFTVVLVLITEVMTLRARSQSNRQLPSTIVISLLFNFLSLSLMRIEHGWKQSQKWDEDNRWWLVIDRCVSVPWIEREYINLQFKRRKSELHRCRFFKQIREACIFFYVFTLLQWIQGLQPLALNFVYYLQHPYSEILKKSSSNVSQNLEIWHWNSTP